ncbi:BnaA05g31430D [Brassica napus]|uniref:(rape) hypothetical protein n=1 Tax=Brassica napus TaxID=3708 RepID=A0A078GRA3_BRANA|nr:agamous-like MADS-box protein AGL80 [Brassica napus]CAF2103048.1 unnamed protein product [Brassica napus]CDY27734.1 BnaA05g31430D [Brassica napus]
MTRRKVKLAFILNNASRKATYKKRKKGLLKKVHELSTLCGIAAGAIIYSPYDPTPEVWPDADGIQQVIAAFRSLPELDQHKNMVNQEEYVKQRIEKAGKLLKKQTRDNREAHFTEVMYQCLMGNMGVAGARAMDLNDLGFLIDQYLHCLDRRIETILGSSNMEIGESSNAVAAAMDQDPSEPAGTLPLLEGATAPAAAVHEVGSSSSSAAAAGASFNQMYPFPQNQQMFYQPSAPFAGYYEQSHNHNQFMEMMNHPEHMAYAANQMGFPYTDNAHHYRQPNQPQPQPQQFFPGESSAAPQRQFFPGESSAAPPPPGTSGSEPPATAPFPPNNIWFR